MKEWISKFDRAVNSWGWKFILAALLLGAFALRMVDLKNPPLDFAGTRQLFSALKARAIYYRFATNVPEAKRTQAISLGNVGIVEPPILENIVGQTYRLVGEHLWIARIYSSFFWVIAGLALFLLIREFASTSAAMIGTIFYLFLPFGVIASRAFMPDPLMVCLIIFSLWALFRWQNTSSWKWAIAFGVLGGLTLLVKNLSIFVLVGGFAGVILGWRGFKRALLDPQVWVMAALLVIPAGSYELYAINKHISANFALRFFPNMWIDPGFYFRWAFTVNANIGWLAVLVAILSIFLADPKRERPLLIGMWVGYFLFGMTFSYHFYTHDYYQLSFIPVVAISMAPALRLFFDQFFKLSQGLLPRLILPAVVLIGMAVPVWYARDLIVQADYYNEPNFWAKLGDKLGHDGGVIGLTEDYGYRLAYWGWQGSAAWFTSADIGLRYRAGQNINLLEKFEQDTAGKKYFVVTMFGELDKEPAVKDILYKNYHIYAENKDYVIFNLQYPLGQ